MCTRMLCVPVFEVCICFTNMYVFSSHLPRFPPSSAPRYSVLESIKDWDALDVTAWVIEKSDDRISPLMVSKGYEEAAKVGSDLIFVKKKKKKTKTMMKEEE